MSTNIITKAIGALAQSTFSILNCNDSDETKAAALAESFDQFQNYLDRHIGGDIVEKSGAHDLAGRLIEHLTDALGHKRRLHGYEKREESDNMDTLHAIMKDGGIAKTCAAVAKGETSISEHELVEAVTKVAHDRHPELSPAQAYAKVHLASTDEGRVLREAIKVAKQPQVTGGGEWRDAGDAAAAMDQLGEIGRRMAPTATPEKQFSVAFEDPKNQALARRAYSRPTAPPGGAYPMPR